MLTFTSYASGSTGNVNTLTDGEATVMLDCGLPWRKVREMMRFNTSSIGGIFITHQHGDHCKGVRDAVKAGLDIYLLRETREAMGLSGHRFHDLEYGKPVRIGTMRVLPFPLVHDVPCCGFLISGGGEKAVYITDTAFVPNKMPPDLNILSIECNYCDDTLAANLAAGYVHPSLRHRVANSHFGLTEVLEFLKANDFQHLRQIHLLHLSDGNSDELQIQVSVEDAVPGCEVIVAGSVYA